MSEILKQVLELVSRGDVRVSEHGYDELAADDIQVRDVLEGLRGGQLIEEYPDYFKGPCVLVLQKDSCGGALHVVWGIPRDSDHPAVLVTAYRPDPNRWTDGFTRRMDV